MYACRSMRQILAATLIGLALAPALPSSQTTRSEARRAEFRAMFARGYFPGRTGQLLIVPREGDILTRPDPNVDFMHGSPWPYDTRIPMFFVGRGVTPGVYPTAAVQQDVAVTIASALGMSMPPTATGHALPGVKPAVERPRAVLLAVLDGMRTDYFERYAAAMPTLTGLRKKSAWFSNARVNYLPTNTGAGHSSIATGSPPSVHGIVGNNMFDRVEGKRHDMLDGWDPRDLVVLSLADVWQLSTGGKGRVIAQGSSMPASVALAGHGACQLGGSRVVHAGYDEFTGFWRTDPDCFARPQELLAFDATALWPADGRWMGHKIDTASDVRRSGLFPRFEADAFVTLIETQPIGDDAVTDLLLLNYKGADYVGHKHGPDSPELRATLGEMDRQFARILQALEAKMGTSYLLAFTADHGMPGEPSTKDRRHFAPDIVATLHARFDPDAKRLVTYYEPENAQIFVDMERLAALKLTLKDLAAFLESQPFIYAAFTEDEVRR